MSFKSGKSILAASIAIALGLPALAQAQAFTSGPILFDRDGAGGFAPISVNSFNWTPNTVLAKNVLTTTVTSPDVETTANTFNVYSQGTLGTFSTNTNFIGQGCGAPGICGPKSGTEFTFEVTSRMSVDSFNQNPGDQSLRASGVAGGTNFFKVWYDPTPDSGTAAAILAGSGFGAGSGVNSCGPGANAPSDGSILILCGRVAAASLSFDDTTGANARLDSQGSDDYAGIGSMQGLGSAAFEVDVVYQNSAYFIQALSKIGVDLQHNGTTNLGFTQVTPSQRVVGETWDVGVDNALIPGVPGATANRNLNNFNCRDVADGDGSSTCSVVFQGLPTTSFALLPEPGSLALLGLGLGLAGFVKRRRPAA
jgi:hypothetical protein